MEKGGGRFCRKMVSKPAGKAFDPFSKMMFEMRQVAGETSLRPEIDPVEIAQIFDCDRPECVITVPAIRDWRRRMKVIEYLGQIRPASRRQAACWKILQDQQIALAAENGRGRDIFCSDRLQHPRFNFHHRAGLGDRSALISQGDPGHMG